MQLRLSGARGSRPTESHRPPLDPSTSAKSVAEGASLVREQTGSLTSAWRTLQASPNNLVTWSRALPLGLEEALAAWVASSPTEFDRVIAPESRALERATHGLAEPHRSWLSSDVRMLLTHFARFTRARRLRVWLGAVQTDQCRKFHVDYVRYRLVTTYLGPGTDWVPDHAVCRDALQDSPDCPLEANRAIVPDPSAVRRALAGEVLLMKGARHEQKRGAVHRSPPIEGTGAVRVLLSVSSVEERV